MTVPILLFPNPTLWAKVTSMGYEMEKKMAFQKLPDHRGMIYVPDVKPGSRKHPCSDCFSCQWCGNERCRTCRSGSYRNGKKGSVCIKNKKNCEG